MHVAVEVRGPHTPMPRSVSTQHPLLHPALLEQPSAQTPEPSLWLRHPPVPFTNEQHCELLWHEEPEETQELPPPPPPPPRDEPEQS